MPAAANSQTTANAFNKAALTPTAAQVKGAELIEAVQKNAGNLQSIKDFCAKGADLTVTTADGASALMYAVLRKDQDVAKILLEAGAPPEGSTVKGLSPLMWSANLGDKDMGYLLLDHGADIHKTTADGRTAGDIAADNNRPWLRDKLNMYAIAVEEKNKADAAARDVERIAAVKEQARQKMEEKLQAGMPTVNPVSVMKKIRIQKAPK